MRLNYLLCIGLALTACSGQAAPDVDKPVDYSEFPTRSQPYLGLIDPDSDNPSWFAGLVDVESRYNPFAISPAGAYGLTQIMPSNYEWLENGMCRKYGRARPESVDWQMGCGQILFEWGKSWSKEPPLPTYCENQALASMLYNGGYHGVWEIKYSDGTIAGGKEICGTKLPNGRKRSRGSCLENYSYPVKIGNKQQLFKGLGGTICLTNSWF